MKAIIVLMVALSCHWWVADASALSARGPECQWYTYQEDAQADFDMTEEDFPSLVDMYIESMDPDGNGIVCDELSNRPSEIADALKVRAKFDHSGADETALFGIGLKDRFYLIPAGVDLTDNTCDDLLSIDQLNSALLGADYETLDFYIFDGDNDSVRERGRDDIRELDAIAYAVVDDPSNPILLNEWLLSEGLGSFERRTAPESISDRLQVAEDSARDKNLGIWGDCDPPEVALADSAASADYANPYEPMMQQSGKGDSTIQVAIEESATYMVSLDAFGGDSIFVAVDIYTMDGTWLPELSVTTGSSGTYSSAGWMESGEYYIQIKAVGSWRVTIDPME